MYYQSWKLIYTIFYVMKGFGYLKYLYKFNTPNFQASVESETINQLRVICATKLFSVQFNYKLS